MERINVEVELTDIELSKLNRICNNWGVKRSLYIKTKLRELIREELSKL